MKVDDYSTTELINELKLHAQSFDHKIVKKVSSYG